MRHVCDLRAKVNKTHTEIGRYCVPTLPIYTAAKHGIVGFVRSFGAYLPEEQITMNAVLPNVRLNCLPIVML